MVGFVKYKMVGGMFLRLAAGLECCYQTLICTSTPLGSSSFMRASTVLAVEL